MKLLQKLPEAKTPLIEKGNTPVLKDCPKALIKKKS